jgi:hypothetical protein
MCTYDIFIYIYICIYIFMYIYVDHLSSAANSEPQSPVNCPSVVTYTESMSSSVVPSILHTFNQGEMDFKPPVSLMNIYIYICTYVYL